MLIQQMTAPLDVLQEEHCTERMFQQLGSNLFNEIPFDTPVVIKLSNEYRQDREAPYATRIITCNITAVQNEYVTIPHNIQVPMIHECKKSRIVRLKQLIKGE